MRNQGKNKSSALSVVISSALYKSCVFQVELHEMNGQIYLTHLLLLGKNTRELTFSTRLFLLRLAPCCIHEAR